VRDDDDVDSANLKIKASTNDTTLSEKNELNMADSIGEHT
jgi:hypothetical protein